MGRKPPIILDDAMSATEMADILRQIVFTAAHGWERSVRLTRGARDILVEALREYGKPY